MEKTGQEIVPNAGTPYFLTEILGTEVFIKDKKIGKLDDFVIVDGDKVAEVTHLYVFRPFGYPALLIPWEKVKVMTTREIVIDIDDPEKYVGGPGEGAILLRDYVLDKKVLDIEGKEVDVVYDVKMILRNNKLYVSEVDISQYGFLKRMRLKRVARLIKAPHESHQNGTIPWTYIQPLPQNISSFKGDVKLKVLKEKISEIPPVDLADILEELDHEQRLVLFSQLETEHASDTLEEINPNVQRALISSLEKKHVASLINEMTPGQAADVLAILPWWDVKAILKLMDSNKAKKIKEIIDFHEEKIINFTTIRFLQVPPDMTVGQAKYGYPKLAKNMVVIMYLYVVDDQDRLLGVIDIKELLKADDTAFLKDIMVEHVIRLSPENTLKEAATIFVRYGFRAIPVTDENNRLIGVVPYRDVMNLTHYFI
jgi:CBS domain-containing protein/sporulation protein YlmC with PRC-barrel domain